jgi:serine/threonine protein phosphatase PrpC
MENIFSIVSAAVSDRGLSKKRPENEDSFLELGHCGIYAVADGVGGALGGEVASQMAVEILSEACSNKADGVDAEDILRAAIDRANAAIYQTALELPALEGMATTIVALHISGNTATIGHVGDSRLYRVDPNRNLHQETDDHSMVADEVRAGRMTAEQAETHPGRNIINRALGAQLSVDIDLKTILIEPGSTFLLCSDGITRHISDEEIGQILTAGTTPDSICGDLKTLCYERGAEDNLTAVVVTIGTRDSAHEPIEAHPAIEEEDTIATARTVHTEASDELGRPEEEASVENAASGGHSNHSRVFSNTGTFLSLDDPASPPDGLDKSWLVRTSISIGLLILGGLIGFAVYHFLFAAIPQIEAPSLSEMKSDNIAMTSYEKLRRTVDGDPAAYLKEVPPPRDAEDFYLAARAQMLTGDFAGARASLLESQKQLSSTDISNAEVLATDIASALAIANDAEAQKRFRSEIDSASKFHSPAGSNANVTR